MKGHISKPVTTLVGQYFWLWSCFQPFWLKQSYCYFTVGTAVSYLLISTGPSFIQLKYHILVKQLNCTSFGVADHISWKRDLPHLPPGLPGMLT